MDRTVKFYNNHAAETAATYEGVDFTGGLERVVPYLPKSGRLLELGAGSGRDAAFWLGRGYDVSAVDGSAAMVDEALRYHPELAGRMVQHQLPTQLPFCDGSFDVVL